METLNTNNHSNIGNLSSIWLAKLEEEKSVLLKHSFEEKQKIFNKTNVVTSNAGIENIFQNCWFNSIVQVVCGSSLLQYFNVKELHNDPVIVHIKNISKMLRDSTTSLTVLDQVGRISDWTNLGTLLGMSSHEGEQRDPLEFYEALVNYVSYLRKQNRNFVLHDSLMFNICSLNSCKYCTQLKGFIEESSSYKAVVFPSKFDVAIKSLLWNSAYCRYSFESLGVSRPCMVNKILKERVYLESWVLLQAPSLLVIYTDRVACGNGRKLLTPVLIDEQLNLEMAKMLPLRLNQSKRINISFILHKRRNTTGKR